VDAQGFPLLAEPYLDPDFLDRLELQASTSTPSQQQPQVQPHQQQQPHGVVDLPTRYAHLQALSAKLGLALKSNEVFQAESVKLMTALNGAGDRSAELEHIARDLVEEVGQPTQDALVEHPSLHHVTLPWFKHFHGKVGS
jgi:hypothetical protein